MNARITCTTAVVTAHAATVSLTGLWSSAYAAVAHDVSCGVTLRDISDALRKEGIKASKDLVSDMALADRLTTYGDVFLAAHAEKVGADRIMLAHSLITKARIARGVAYVRSVLDTLDASAAEDGEKAMAKAVKELHAAKREVKKDTTDTATDEATDEATTDEAPAATPAPEPSSLAQILAAIAPLALGAINRIDRGETLTEDEAASAAAMLDQLRGRLHGAVAVAV